jgi:hypothetical protein
VPKVAVALLVFACWAGAVTLPAAADEPLANVVSWTPNDVRPDEPVSIELSLSGVGSPRADAVEVVIRGDGGVRRFPTKTLGSGRYSTQIVFPEAGSWRVLVAYGDGEVPLGKGAICVAADCIGQQPDARAAEQDGRSAWWWIGLGALAVASFAATARAVRAFRRRGGRGAAMPARLDGPPARGRRGTSAS